MESSGSTPPLGSQIEFVKHRQDLQTVRRQEKIPCDLSGLAARHACRKCAIRSCEWSMRSPHRDRRHGSRDMAAELGISSLRTRCLVVSCAILPMWKGLRRRCAGMTFRVAVCSNTSCALGQQDKGGTIGIGAVNVGQRQLIRRRPTLCNSI